MLFYAEPTRTYDALALQAGGSRRRERAWQLLESGAVDRAALRSLLVRHAINVDIGDGT